MNNTTEKLNNALTREAYTALRSRLYSGEKLSKIAREQKVKLNTLHTRMKVARKKYKMKDLSEIKEVSDAYHL